jgi:hypothetical protein
MGYIYQLFPPWFFGHDENQPVFIYMVAILWGAMIWVDTNDPARYIEKNGILLNSVCHLIKP